MDIKKKMESALYFRLSSYLPAPLKVKVYRHYNKSKGIGFDIVEGKDYFEYRFNGGLSMRIAKDSWMLEEFWSRIPHMTDGDLGRYELREGDVVIDCGAYIGVFTLYAAKLVGERGKVIAYEPDPLNYERLKRNVEMNGLKNVALLNKATWSSRGSMKFDNKGLGTSTLFVDKKDSPIIPDAKEAKDVIEVPIVTIDEEAEELGLGHVDFIKMDIEGAEIETVKGAVKVLAENDVHLAIASNHIVDGRYTKFALEELFPKMGYGFETAYPAHLTTYAWKKK
ncbi:MAG: FkbM family methyltransferase [Candidatus Micrarchaeota archaeon]